MGLKKVQFHAECTVVLFCQCPAFGSKNNLQEEKSVSGVEEEQIVRASFG